MRVLAIIACSILISACARTSITSFSDPDAGQYSPPMTVIVFATELGLDGRQRVEQVFVDQLSAKGFEVTRSIDRFPPTRQFEPVEILMTSAGGYDAIMLVDLLDQGEDLLDVPPTYIPGQTTGSVDVIGNTAYFNSTSTPGQMVGGYTIRRPTSKIGFYLYETGNLTNVWRAEVDASGPGRLTYVDLAEASSRKAITQLFSDSILSESVPANTQ